MQIDHQFGSRPNQLVFASGLFATARAARAASFSLRAPRTVTVTNLVAPSPSAAICRASETQTASSASRKASKSAPARVICALPASPLASRKTESFVDSSPSTTSLLKLLAIASDRARRSIADETAASVVMKPSIVAMFGSIMPEPLLIPPTTTFLPPITVVTHACLGFVSVVITAFSAARPCSYVRPSAAFADLMPASSRSIGSGRPMTPVDATRTCSGLMPSSPAVTSAESLASFMPRSPVHALAQPEFARIAWTHPPLTTSRSSTTGAAATLLVVNTAAAAHGASATISATSFRPLYLISAATPAARNPFAVQTPPFMFFTLAISLFVGLIV